MTNVYDLTPEDPEDFDPSGLPWTAHARASAIRAIDHDPDEMAAAVQLTQDTGVSPGLVYPNLPKHQRNARAYLTGNIVDRNPYLQDYINANPTHPVISNDDWAQLATVSDKLKAQDATSFSYSRPFKDFYRGLEEGVGPGGVGHWIDEKMGPDWSKRYPASAWAWTALGLPIEVPLRLLSGAGVGASRAAEGLVEELTGDKEKAGQVFSALMAGLEYGGVSGMARGPGHMRQTIGFERNAALRSSILAAAKEAGIIEPILRPFAEGNQPVPPGLHPAIDKVKLEQAKVDAKVGDEVLKESEASTTRERSPEAFRAMVGEHPPLEIRIPADAIRRLYGEKEPVPEDGKLGWIPNINQQLREAEATGGNVKVSRADFLANVDRETYDLLHDDIIWRKEGVSIAEGEALKEDWDRKKEEEKVQAKETETPPKEVTALPELVPPEIKQEALPEEMAARPGTGEVVGFSKGKNELPGVMTPEEYSRYLDEWTYRQIEERYGKERADKWLAEKATKREEAFPENVVPLRITVRPMPKTEEVVARKAEVSGAVEGFGRDAILRSDTVRDEAKVVAEERGIPLEEAFAEVANDLFQQNGVKEELTPVAAKLYLDRDTAVKSLRAVAGTEPEELAALAGVKELRLRQEKYPGAEKDRVSGAHSFVITDQNGRPVASLLLTEVRDGKDLYIEWIGAGPKELQETGGPGFVFGPKLTISAFNAIASQFPNAERIGGYRVSGAREKAAAQAVVWIDIARFRKELAEAGGTKPLLDQLRDVIGYRARDVGAPAGERGMWHNIGRNIREFTPRAWRPDERAAAFEVFKYFNRILPDSVRVRPVRGLTIGRLKGRDEVIGGVYTEFDERGPLILFALGGWKYLTRAGKPFEILNTIRHEAMHALRRGGFIRPEEWEILRKAAIDNDWISKHDIEKNYSDKSYETQLEEAIAHEYGEWGSKRRQLGFPEGVRQIFSRMKQLFEEVQRIFRKVTGSDPVAEDLFKGIERGDFKYRPRTEPEMPAELRTKREPVELEARGRPPGKAKPPAKGMAEPMFEPKALGLTQKYYDLYQKHMDKMDQEDLVYQIKHLEAYERRRQTAEWKAYEESIKDEVAADVLSRPDVAVANFFRNGIVHGGDMGKRFKLDPEKLTPEQRAALPESLVGKGGLDPDVIAGEFDFPTGDILVDRLAKFEQARGEKNTTQYTNELIKNELERRVKSEFGGPLDENIIREVEEHIVSNGELDRIHEDVLRSADTLRKAEGVEGTRTEKTFTKKEVKGWAEQEFGERLVSRVDTMDDFRTSGKARRLTTRALLDRDYKSAFKYDTQRELAMNLAAESKKFDKDMAAYDRVKRQFLNKREVPSVDQPYTNFIRQILGKIEEMSDAKLMDINTEIAAGDWKTLEEFVKAKQTLGFPLEVADFLYDPAYRKPVAEMTVNEFRGVLESLKALATVGRNEKKLIKGTGEVNFRETVDKMVEAIKELPGGKEEKKDMPKGAIRRTLNYLWASSLTMESVFNRFDKSNPLGVFNTTLVNMFSHASNYESALEKKFSKALQLLPPIKSINKKVENPFFIDNRTGEYISMSRRHLLGALQYVGSKSSFEKLLGGYDIPLDMAPEFMKWLFENTTKEDWDRAQGLGDLFGRAKRESDQMYRDLTGVAPMSIEPWDINTPWGTYRGWYNPVVYDKNMKQKSVKLRGEMPLLEEGHWERAGPAAGYTKTRTKYVGPVELDLDSVSSKFYEIIHDIAFRPTVVQLNKVFKDNDFRAAMTTHYGQHYTDMLDQFVRDIKGGNTQISEAASTGRNVIEFFRQNALSHYLGLNPKTISKHTLTAWMNSITEVGVKDFHEALFSILGHQHDSGVTNWRFAVSNSLELQRRHRNYLETIRGSHDRVFGNMAAGADLKSWLDNFTDRPVHEGLKLTSDMLKAKILNLRDMIMWAEALPLASLDFASAVPTWLGRYKRGLKETGGDHEAAVQFAERAVRRAHGSTALTNRPEIARSDNPYVQTATSFYGFFSHMLQRSHEFAWAIRGAARGDKYYKDSKAYKVGLAAIAPITVMLWSYFIFPGMVEETVTPIHGTKDDDTLTYLTKVGALTTAARFIGIREVAHAMIGGHIPSHVGLVDSMVKDMFAPLVQHKPKRGTPAYARAQRKLIEYNAMFSALTGMSNSSVPRMGVFGYNTFMGYDKPQTMREFWNGISTGYSREKK
jgi:hypothetical protein